MNTLPGNPTLLKVHADGLVSSANKIQAAIDELHAFTINSSAKSLNSVSSKVSDARGGVATAHGRYMGTGRVLQTYQERMDQAHRKAREAATREARIGAALSSANQDYSLKQRQVEELARSDVPAQVVREAEQRRDYASAAVTRQQQAQKNARDDFDAAAREMRTAAEDAARQIDTAINASNDGFLDKVTAAVDALKNTVARVAKWVAQKLVELVKAVVEVIRKIAIVLAVVLAVVLVVFAFGLAAATLLALVILASKVAAIAIALKVLAAVATLVATVEVGALLLEDFEWSALAKLRGVIRLKALSYAAVGLLFHKVVSRLRVSKYQSRNDSEARAEQTVRDRYSEGGVRARPIDTVDDLMDSMLHVNAMGGKDRAVIDIKQVGDNPKRWIVTIPHTETGAEGKAGPHDHLLNVVMPGTSPQLQFAYERAIAAAMREAGIGPTDEVMMMGFSQGGMIATRFAANPSSGFNITRVLAVGAPQSHYHVPQVNSCGNSVHTLSVDHAGDWIGGADSLFDLSPGREEHRTDVVVPMVDQNGVEVQGKDPHDVAMYQNSVRKIVESNPDLNNKFADFLNKPVRKHELIEVSE